jgi:putative transposase
MRKPYTTDLSDAEWNHIEPHLPAANGFGRPRAHSLREILNAVFYVLKSGPCLRTFHTVSPRTSVNKSRKKAEAT